jgi:hypothetical protein
MIKLNTEYFSNPYYFLISEKEDRISLYYSVGLNLNESRMVEQKIDFDKKDMEKVKKGVFNILKGRKIKTKENIKKYFEPIEKTESELDEFVDEDGTLSNSSIPIYDKGLSPLKTTDQIVPATRDVINPVTRGYRKYYGEGKDNRNDVVNEVDYSEAFGYEETKDMDGETTYKYLVKTMGMTPDEARERTKQFGKDPYGKKTQNAPKSIKNKKGFIDRMTLSEIERQKMIKVLDEILLSKKSSDSEISKKEQTSSKLLKKNLQSIKKLADKEGISINQIIKMLKSE